jgi:hypothetical protein
MVRLGIGLVLAVVTAWPAATGGQTKPAAPADVVRGKHLEVRLDRDRRSAVPGATITLYADVVPGPKIHVYAPGQKDYISIELNTKADDAFKVARPSYPAAVDVYFEPLRETIKVFDKPFRIAQDLTIAATPAMRRRAAARETLEIAATLDYQACDDAVCFRPESLSLTWRVRLGPAQNFR